jgi:hypothetical protein
VAPTYGGARRFGITGLRNPVGAAVVRRSPLLNQRRTGGPSRIADGRLSAPLDYLVKTVILTRRYHDSPIRWSRFWPCNGFTFQS